ncbi:hypothetical protein IC619_011400 [Hazenella sp. IB182353]|uniref:hypothetical protein n=1 Tax=Polycladospora coralii TaxID=2771432 RepID=UPI0019B19DB4|nr:hypothetical protein [Polycladospora coralii]MBS7531100.1 hypothetical protein [Polycladospora coralii]
MIRCLFKSILVSLVSIFLFISVAYSAGTLNSVNGNLFILGKNDMNLPEKTLELDKELNKSGIQNLLAEANRQAEHGCNSLAISDVSDVIDSWCFNTGDNLTNEWYPQGISGVGDAQQDDLWGNKQAFVVSWYHKDKGVRISFLDPETGKYRHVLLVEPYTNSYGNPSYKAVNIHAGGIVWYGNYLYVADTTEGFRVFDMRNIYDLTSSTNGDVSDKDKVGRHNGTYYGHGYRYVMAQVGAWTIPEQQTGSSGCTTDAAPRFSFVGLDRSTAPDSLVSGEYCNPPNPENDATLYGRMARWPLQNSELKTSSDGLAHATAIYPLPKAHAQGALTLNDHLYVMTSAGEFSHGKLYKTTPNGEVITQTAGIGPEDLYYWPARNELWTVTEYPGRRVMYAVRP